MTLKVIGIVAAISVGLTAGMAYYGTPDSEKEEIRRDLVEANGYDVRLVEYEGGPFVPLIMGVGKLNPTTRAFEGPTIIASDSDGDGNIDGFKYLGVPQCTCDPLANAGPLRELGSLEKLTEIQNEVLKDNATR